MGADTERRKTKIPPLGASVVIFAFILLVPLYQWLEVRDHDGDYGLSLAAQLDGPYFRAVVALRALGAPILAGLLLAVRKPGAIWVTITACWLAGPPLTFLLNGIFALAASIGENSVPTRWVDNLVWSALFPLLVTACLLGSRRVRQHYEFRKAARAQRKPSELVN